ncbi:MAG: DUF6049 family protein [Microbacteriaceae bacterium]|jgi:hypothetical protein|nr:DUF6049 family protein [Microbacteriaceae bacterium]
MRTTARHLIAYFLALGMVLLTSVPAALPATAASTSTTARTDVTTPNPDQPVVDISVAHHSRLNRDTNLDVTVTVTAPQSSSLQNIPVVLSMRRSLITQTQEVTGWMKTDSPARTTVLATSAPLQLTEGQQGTVHLQVPASQIPTWRYRSLRGALGFEVRLGTNGTRTPFLTSWNTTSENLRAVRMVFPVTTSAGTSELLSATDLATLTSPTGQLTAQLDALDHRSVLIAVDPRIPASIAALGNSAPRSASTWLTRLKAQSHVIPLLYGNADPNTIGSLGAQSLPDTDISGLLSWDRTDLTVVRNLTPTGARVLQNSGIRSVIIQSDSTTATSSELQETPLHTGELQLLASDPTLSHALTQIGSATSSQEESTRLATLEGLSLISSLADSELPSLTVLAPQSWTRHLDAYQPLLSSMGNTLGVKWSGSATPFSATHSVSTKLVSDASTSTAGSPSLESLLQSLNTVNTFAKAAVDGSPETSANRTAMTLLGFGWKSDSDTRQLAISHAVTSNNAYSSALSFSSTSNLTLVSGNSTIPVPVRNDSDWPVLVSVQTKPSNGRAKVSRQVQVRIDPHATETAKVPVTAVANGTVTLNFHLLASDGTELAQPITREMTIRADWEGWGVAGIAIAAGALFIIGLYRSFRRHRRLRQEARSANDPPSQPSDSVDVSRETSTDRDHLSHS